MNTNLKHPVYCLVVALCLALGLTLVSVPAYAEDIDTPSDELLALMEADGAQTEFDTRGSMPKTGEGRIFAVRVAFPAGEDEDAMGFDEGDTVEALDAMIDGSSHEYPYESVQAYYYRSSYGKLTISGDAVDYVAEYPRSHYDDDSYSLCTEILAALDAETDYRDYDGNGDGIIDCMAVRFAGPDSGWGTTWWSKTLLLNPCDEAGDMLLYDGMAAASCVLLHRPSDTESGMRTFIHEIGHSLGLPDYYQTSGTTKLSSGGILTSDMMFDNIGDQNGFSKWMLGWLDDSQVTWVTVGEDGVWAVRGGTAVGTPTDDGGVSLDLDPFTGADPSKTGGIIVIADHAYDKFSSYYVLQYDTYAGNQSLFWGIDAWNPISGGFRMYRVQAALDEDGYTIKTNRYGSVHDQLIELVDPDEYLDHYSEEDYNVASTGQDGDRWACMLYEGSLVSPSTYPSTNFFENASAGWTGISVEVVRSDADGGSIVVRYDPSEKPSSEPPELNVADDSKLVCGGALRLYANTNVTLTPEAQASIRLDGDLMYACSHIEAYGPIVELETNIDADVLDAASRAEIVFEEGSFLLFGGAISPAISIEVPIGGIDLAESGNLDGGSYRPSVVSLTEVLEDEDGTRYFYQCDHALPFVGERTFFKNIIDPADPTKVTKVPIEGAEAEKAQAVFLDKSFMSETSPADRVGYLVPEGADLGEFDRLLDAVESDDRIYVLSQSWGGGVKRLSVFEKDGTPVGSVFTPYSDHNYGRVLVGPTGVVAVTVYPPFHSTALREVTYFFDENLNLIDSLTTNGNAASYWLDDGRFITYGWRYQLTLAPDASFEDPYFTLCYDITERLGEAAPAGGWVQYQGAWYYHDENGRWLVNQWLNYDGAWYHFAANGKCQWSTWISWGGNWYYLGADGKAVINGWVNYKGAWYYMDENGRPLVNRWLNYEDAWYHFAANGKCEWSTWVSYDGNWYYLGSDGKVSVDAWVNYKGSWYYVGSDGAAVADTWVVYDGLEYYINDKGVATGESREIA